MKLILYNNFSETNQLNKNISKIIELEGSLLDATSIINPVIKIFFNPESMDGYVVDDNQVYITFNGMKITWDSFIYDYVLAANYAYIPEFNRYYFINDIISVRKNIWQLVMNVDVLMSYKDHILKLDAFITRNENDFNPYLNDEKISFSNEKSIEYIMIENTDDCKKFNSNISPETDDTSDIYSYIVSVISVHEPLSSYVHDAPANDALPPISIVATGNSINTYYAILPYTDVNHLCSEVFDDDNKRTFIKSIISLPFEPDKILGESSATRRTIVLGHDNIYLESEGRTSGNYIPSHWAYDRIKFADFTFLEKPKDFKDLNPYTRYMLYCPYCDYIEIPPFYLGDRIQVYYSVNYDDGSSTIIVYDYTKKCVIDSRTARLGVKVGVSSSNLTEIVNQKTALALNTTIGVLGSVISTVGGVYSGNPVAAGMGIMGGVKTISNAITTSAQLYDRGNVDISTGQTGLLLPQQFHLKIEKIIPADEQNYSKLYGKPLYEMRKLNTLKGFTAVGDLHIENIASATRTEHDQLKALLEEGIIL